MSNKVKGSHELVGFIGPVFIFSVIVWLESLFGKEQLCILSGSLIANIELGRSIFEFSSYPCFLASLFFLSFITVPFQCFYWWKVLPRELKKSKENISKFKITVGVVFLISLYVFLWLIPIEMFSDRGRNFYISIFEYPILFYLMVLFPLYLSAVLIVILAKVFHINLTKKQGRN